MSILNLNKNDVLDLTKKDPTLKNIMLAAGWDVADMNDGNNKNIDLDLSAILLNDKEKLIENTKKLGKFIGKKDGIINFFNKNGKGIFLHGDNLTGEGSGDDEKISISLNELPSDCEKVIFLVNIFSGKSRNQDFSKVRNAYIRLLDTDKNNNEICRYNLSEDGRNATCLLFAELTKVNGNWTFKAIGELISEDVSVLANRYK